MPSKSEVSNASRKRGAFSSAYTQAHSNGGRVFLKLINLVVPRVFCPRVLHVQQPGVPGCQVTARTIEGRARMSQKYVPQWQSAIHLFLSIITTSENQMHKQSKLFAVNLLSIIAPHHSSHSLMPKWSVYISIFCVFKPSYHFWHGTNHSAPKEKLPFTATSAYLVDMFPSRCIALQQMHCFPIRICNCIALVT